MSQPHLQPIEASRPPIETSLFDFFKVGPGPSSSHTIGPMKAGYDFLERCRALPEDTVAQAASLRMELLGSLSATGKGHGTDSAVLAGLLGSSPESCAPELLPSLLRDPEARHSVRLGDTWLTVSLTDIEFGPVQHEAPFSNTLQCSLRDAAGQELFGMESR